MYEDKIRSKRIHILLDIIEREGFYFSAANMHRMIRGIGSLGLRTRIYKSREVCEVGSTAVLGYSVLYWGSSIDVNTSVFATRVHNYYAARGELNVYWGMIDEL